MISVYSHVLDRLQLADELLLAGAPDGAGRELAQATRLAQEITGPKRRCLLKLIALGRDDVAAALPRTAGEWAAAADGRWPA